MTVIAATLLALNLALAPPPTAPDSAPAHAGHGAHAAHPDTPPAPAAVEQSSRALPREGGQSAFAALGEIADMLQADPSTDWSKVDLDGLRAHLIDMDNVVLRAQVRTTAIAGGARFDVAGETDAVRDSIRRIVGGHAAMAGNDRGRVTTVGESPKGATVTVTAPDAAGIAQIRALGFFGLVTGGGDHHQRHHLMMAKGQMRH